ncbi:MAG: hypothetical protein ACI8QS_002081 [Planctomycetota bacterium]
MKVSDPDKLLILDYIDGRLSTEQMMQFEVRLSQEEDLAACFESFESMDQLERQLALVRAQPPRLRYLVGGRRLVALAAAGLLVLTAGYLLNRDPGVSKQRQIAILPSSASWTSLNRQVGLDPEWIDTDPSTLRGGGVSGENYREYYEQLTAALEDRYLGALTGGPNTEATAHFNLVLQLDKAASVVVLLIDSAGRVLDVEGVDFQVAFPGIAPWTAATGRIGAGELVVLPERNARWIEEGQNRRATLDSGFLVPLRAGEIAVLVGLREEALDDELRVSLEETLGELRAGQLDPEQSNTRLRAWLGQAGFEVSAFAVKEP